MKTIKNSKKAMIVTTGIAIAVAVSIAGFMIQSPSLALPNSSMGISSSNATTTTIMPQRVNITGSTSISKIIQDNVKVSFTDAASAAQKQVSGGNVVGGHLGVVQGYIVYAFKVVNTTNNTSHLVIVDAGNGQVLHVSQGYQMGHFAGGSGYHGFGYGARPWHHRGMW